jgi:hypothetical protein
MMLGTHAIKIKAEDMGRFEFLTPDGRLTHLRIHAAWATPERCEVQAAKIRSDNPTATVKVVTL